MCISKTALLLLCPLFVFAEVSLKSLSLLEAERIALEYNKALLIAEEGTLQAMERKDQAVSRFLPSLEYRAEFRDIEKKELFFNVFSDQFVFSHQGYSSIFEIDQPIFSSHLIFDLKSKKLEVEVYRYSKANTQNELLLAVRNHYFQVLFFQKALEIKRENIDYLAYALDQEQKKLEAGNSTPFEVNQSKVAVSNALSSYYMALKSLKKARNALIISLGVDPLLEPELYLKEKDFDFRTVPEIQIKLDLLSEKYDYPQDTFPSSEDYLARIDSLEYTKNLTLFTEDEQKDFLSLALAARPDLQAKKIEVDVATQNVNQKLGTYLPHISGYVRYSYNDVDLGTKPFFQQDYNWSAGVVFSWKLFDSFLREHEVKEARSMRSSSQIGYEKKLQAVEVQVRNSLYLLEEAVLSFFSATQGTFLAEQARFQAQEKLKYGRIAPLEYRDSVNQLADARNQQNQASLDLVEAYYMLRFATGRDAETNLRRIQ